MDNNDLSNIVVNYNEHDPISLELIKDLPLSKLFFVTNKITNKKYAYDAINWFIHIANDRRHPITREKLSIDELWNLYLIATTEYNFITDIGLIKLLQKSIDKYHSPKIKFLKDNKNVVKIIPVSPLFSITIKKFSTIFKNNLIKRYKLVYQLVDSRNRKNIVCDQRQATLELPIDMNMTFSQ